MASQSMTPTCGTLKEAMEVFKAARDKRDAMKLILQNLGTGTDKDREEAATLVARHLFLSKAATERRRESAALRAELWKGVSKKSPQ